MPARPAWMARSTAGTSAVTTPATQSWKRAADAVSPYWDVFVLELQTKP